MDFKDLTTLRKQFLLDPDIVFLNHGSFGATPLPVFENFQYWQRELERQPVEFLGRRAAPLLSESRQELASYLGTAADNLVYVTNATHGLNIVARSLRLHAGDEVLTSDHEYGALDRTWRFLALKQGFKYINHPLKMPVTTPAEFVDDFWQGVNANTRVIFISHITSPSAMVFPVAEICRRAQAAGIITVVDGAHAPGQVPLSLDQLGADFYSGNLHKWLCAPKGSAFLYARPTMQHVLEPLVVSWGWQSETPGPSRFIDEQEWTGTRDLSAFLAVPAAIAFQRQNHWAEVQALCHQMASLAHQRIAALTGLPALHPDSPVWYAQMGAMPLPADTDLIALKTQLYDQYRIEIPLTQCCGQKLIRFSFQAYNTLEDIQALENALRQLL